MTNNGLPRRQRLVGAWLLISGVSLLGGTLFAVWLDSHLSLNGWERLALWLASLSGGVTLLLLGLWLERRLFTPLRHLQGQLARWVANPATSTLEAPQGWLNALAPDLERVHGAWQHDQARITRARAEGARNAAKIRRELEALLQTLETPLLLCDRHRRQMLFNQSAERFFHGESGLGLGKRLEALVPLGSTLRALDQLPASGAPREFLIPGPKRWVRLIARRLPDSRGEMLFTFADATTAWSSEMGTRAELTALLPRLRHHAFRLGLAAEALDSLDTSTGATTLRARFQRTLIDQSERLDKELHAAGALLETLQRQSERFTPQWSNDFWQTLDEYIDPAHRLITPIGEPDWFLGDAPSLIVLLSAIVATLNERLPHRLFEAEVQPAHGCILLDLRWPGAPLTESTLQAWKGERLAALPLAPTVADILRQHASDAWSLQDDDGCHARLRLALPALEGAPPPRRNKAPRPEFHDFGIADLPPPSEQLARCPLASLEIVAFDTETTGLELRRNDRIVSLGACRIVNQRLLARDTFDRYVHPGRSIPPNSTAIHGITDTDVADAPPLDSVAEEFHAYVGNAVLLAHNAAFDMLALSHAKVAFDTPVLDTLLLSRALDSALDGHDLDTLAQRYDLPIAPGSRHTALGDAQTTATLWLALLPRLEARGIVTLEDALALQASALDREDASTH